MSNLYQSVTEAILEALERGVVPWKKPWRSFNALPINAVTNRPYRGVNVFLLGLTRYQDHRWLTFRQVAEAGGHVGKGEKASLAVFWKLWEPKEDESEEEEAKRIPILRHYHLFNVEQTEGAGISQLHTPDPPPPNQKVERAEVIVQAMQHPPTIAHGGSSAWYRPATDHVQVPELANFTSRDAYYATLFHELGHATGHESRLARKGVTGTIQFGSEDYSQEELVAELTSAFLCAHAGLDNSLTQDAASYIDGWLAALDNDRKMVVYAAAQAQKAADLILAT